MNDLPLPWPDGLPWVDDADGVNPQSTVSYSSTSGNPGADEGSVRVLEAGRLRPEEAVPVQEPASRIELVAIDEFIFGSGTTPAKVETAPHLEHLIGMYDQIAIQVVTDNVVAPAMAQPQIVVDMYHSADGLHWVKKRSVHEVVAFLLSTTSSTYVPIGYDDGTTPSLAFVKLVVTVNITGSGNFSLHVNVRVTCNDAREAQFERQLAREYKRETKDLPAEYWKRQGPRLNECMAALNYSVKNPDANKPVPSEDDKRYFAQQGVPESEHLYKVFPGSPAAVSRCVALGFSKYWAEQEAKSIREAAKSADAQHTAGGYINRDC